MKPQLKWIEGWVDDTPIDLRSYVPPADEFCIKVLARFGPARKKPTDDFEFSICSVRWLEAAVEREKVVRGQHILFVNSYSYADLEKFIDDRVAESSALDWLTTVLRLAGNTGWDWEPRDRDDQELGQEYRDFVAWPKPSKAKISWYVFFDASWFRVDWISPVRDGEALERLLVGHTRCRRFWR